MAATHSVSVRTLLSMVRYSPSRLPSTGLTLARAARFSHTWPQGHQENHEKAICSRSIQSVEQGQTAMQAPGSTADYDPEQPCKSFVVCTGCSFEGRPSTPRALKSQTSAAHLAGGAQVGGGGIHHDGKDAQHHVDVDGVDVAAQEGCLHVRKGLSTWWCFLALGKITTIGSWDTARTDADRLQDHTFRPPIAVYMMMPICMPNKSLVLGGVAHSDGMTVKEPFTAGQEHIHLQDFKVHTSFAGCFDPRGSEQEWNDRRKTVSNVWNVPESGMRRRRCSCR